MSSKYKSSINKNMKEKNLKSEEELYIEKLSQELLKNAKRLFKVAVKLAFIGNGILSFSDDKEDIIKAAIINFLAACILFVATIFQFVENYISKNPIPKCLNKNKLWGSIISLIGTIILIRELIEEYGLNLPTEEIEEDVFE
ncbi:hypothetical protein IRP63_08085 [Clostridium botulinum]|uniref:Uncharacterized protein n=1 Tax=Clostridium botulinum C/D str. DC5 TaxID=1443128 RepID=A0A0A0II99_CLOBO|nr:hypothetical protein [Clostridium botulinum]KEI03812.1 hypothetical protein Z952_07815 [Clostridium botulinum C/D str. BKT75002]KEI09020.1 hypothetical protein Z954_13835 [Clostridium botulinum C/D str. BKT2873]KGM93115.1 hypothetical protein Z956_12355 [Clostridium botulinum D str. CCUG 7971]KGM99285.1 hypothetical protein Z955_08325 [Clostridium botulinum C/D str. DC5]KOC50526.1 hypothetical protein ADU88_02340 [Clostridium botulinum]